MSIVGHGRLMSEPNRGMSVTLEVALEKVVYPRALVNPVQTLLSSGPVRQELAPEETAPGPSKESTDDESTAPNFPSPG